MMNPVLSEIAAAASDRQQQRAIEFEELAECVIGGTIDSAEVPAQLEALGKTLADLQARVTYLETRRAMRAEADQIPALESELAEVRQSIKDEMEAWAGLEAWHTAVITPLSEKEWSLQHRIGCAYNANAKLRQDYKGRLTAELRNP